MNVEDVSMSCFNDNAHEMMVHTLMSCSYDAQMQGKHNKHVSLVGAICCISSIHMFPWLNFSKQDDMLMMMLSSC
jgi:hypothetical protein